MIDPFSIVYAALWELVETSPLFAGAVKQGNRIRFDAGRDPLKQTIAEADLPEVMLTWDGITGANFHATSCHSSLITGYSWLIATGDNRLHQRAHPVVWALACALQNWKGTLSGQVWRGEKFVKRMDVRDALAGRSERDVQRGIAGWSIAWRCEVELWFSTANMVAHGAEPGN